MCGAGAARNRRSSLQGPRALVQGAQRREERCVRAGAPVGRRWSGRLAGRRLPNVRSRPRPEQGHHLAGELSHGRYETEEVAREREGSDPREVRRERE